MDSRDANLISVVIPVYNGAKLLSETLQCVLGQSHTDLEIVVVDDGSTDDSAEIARSFHERVAVHSQSNHGIAFARNVGMSRSKGAFVHFMDADDLLSPNFYESLVGPLLADPDLDATFCAEESFEGPFADRTTLWRSDKNEYDEGLYRTILLRSNLSPANTLYRRSSLGFLGGFDITARSSEDYDFQLRFSRFAKMKRAPEAVYYYRQHGGGMSRSYPLIYRNRLRIAVRHIEAFEGFAFWRSEWREIRRAAAAEACAAIRYNLKRARGTPGELRRQVLLALRFLSVHPEVWPWLLRQRSGR